MSISSGGTSGAGTPAPGTPPGLPHQVETWAVKANGVDHTYGDVHGMIHADISIGNNYRSERIKLMIALATAVFGFTATFHKDLFDANLTQGTLWLIFIGWLLLLVSLLAGVFHLWKWEDFYLEHRSVGNAVWRFRTATTDDQKAAAVRDFKSAGCRIKNYQRGYRWWNWMQFLSLGVGLALLAVYVGISGYKSVTTPRSPTPPACVVCPQP